MRPTRTLLLTTIAVATSVVAFTQPRFLRQDAAEAAQDPAQDVPTIEEARGYLQAEEYEAAEAAFAKIAEAQPNNGQAIFLHAYCLHMNGKLDEAHDRHLAAAAFPQFAARGNYNHACVHALRGEKDIAFVALAEARAAGFDNADQLRDDADMDGIRDDARFAELLLDMQGSSFEGTALTSLAELPAGRRFDFAIGEWQTSRDGEADGVATITRAFEGQGISASSRTNDSGATRSMSTFVYDEEKQVWRQIWVGRDGVHAVLEGGFHDGQIVLTLASLAGQAKTDGRAVYTNIASDSFDLTWQTSEDDGQSWNTEVTLRYARQ